MFLALKAFKSHESQQSLSFGHDIVILLNNTQDPTITVQSMKIGYRMELAHRSYLTTDCMSSIEDLREDNSSVSPAVDSFSEL